VQAHLPGEHGDFDGSGLRPEFEMTKIVSPALIGNPLSRISPSLQCVRRVPIGDRQSASLDINPPARAWTS